jgi:uncharacterized membrane protein YdfJ with MMPL/SSD domain
VRTPGDQVSGALYRLGAFTARHRLATVVVWILFAGGMVGWVHIQGAKTNNNLTLPGTDSQQAFDILAKKFPPQQNGANPFVFEAPHGKLTDPEFKQAMDATAKALAHGPHVYSAINPISKKGQEAGLLSKDGTIAFDPVLLDVNSGFITDRLANDILDVTDPARKAGITVAVGGSIGSTLSAPDTKTSQILGNVAAMVILALVFGSLVAMGTPIVTAIFALAVATSSIGLLGHLIPIPSVGPTLAVMIGLGVGIDYALFLVTKHLEQLESGVDVRESIARAMSSSGTAVVFAGTTVVIALLSLGVAGIPLITSLGISAAIAVLCAVIASITLLTAVLSLLGGSIRRVRIPSFLRPKRRPEGETRWDTWAGWVTSHPWITVMLALLLLAPLIVPLFSLELGQEDIGVTPKSTTERQAYDLMTKGFGVGYNGPLLIAIELDPPAGPSEKYTKKYDEATALQTHLKKEQKRLTAEQKQLEAEQASLERQQAKLEREGDALKRQQAALERQQAALEAEATRLEAQARSLAREAAPLVLRLVAINAREAIIHQRLQHTSDPRERARLKRRLGRLQQRERTVQSELHPLRVEARRLVHQAQQLRAEADALQRQATALAQRATVLQRQAADLKQQGDALQRQADQLQKQANKAKRQKQHALTLKKQLTRMLTKAGGDDRGTDPRIVRLQNAMGAAEHVAGVSPPQINKSGDAAIMNVISTAAPSSDTTSGLVEDLRSSVIPSATSDGGVRAFVGGSTATGIDLATKISQRMLLVVATVIGLSFLFLMLAFRSLLVPAQAAFVNLLTVAAALGILTAVFQWGWGLSLVGLDAPGGSVPIASYVPLMMFAVLFGLSMDYEVFMVSRIQQHRAGGASPAEAVRSGLGAAAHVVTAAALIMFLVFASFIITGDPTVKQFGVGLAAAVFLAGTMIVTLAPAMLVLFGKRAFWVPRFLDRILPHLHVEGE